MSGKQVENKDTFPFLQATIITLKQFTDFTQGDIASKIRVLGPTIAYKRAKDKARNDDFNDLLATLNTNPAPRLLA